jgi:hypothetical protein
MANPLLYRDMIKAEPEGLSYEVVYRLWTLKQIKASLEAEGDSGQHIPNINAIMAAYRSGELTCDDGSVTYWAHGKLIAGPKAPDMAELLAHSKKVGAKGFWVEGVS